MLTYLNLEAGASEVAGVLAKRVSHRNQHYARWSTRSCEDFVCARVKNQGINSELAWRCESRRPTLVFPDWLWNRKIWDQSNFQVWIAVRRQNIYLDRLRASVDACLEVKEFLLMKWHLACLDLANWKPDWIEVSLLWDQHAVDAQWSLCINSKVNLSYFGNAFRLCVIRKHLLSYYDAVGRELALRVVIKLFFCWKLVRCIEWKH